MRDAAIRCRLLTMKPWAVGEVRKHTRQPTTARVDRAMTNLVFSVGPFERNSHSRFGSETARKLEALARLNCKQTDCF